MRKAVRVFAWLALGIAVMVRAVVVANRTEGGWQILGDHLTAGLPPFLDRSYSGADPATRWRWEQAERTAHDPHATANDLLCAAQIASISKRRFVADAPQAIARVAWGMKNPIAPPTEFHDATTRELAARSTDLEPLDPDVWRARILLLFDDSAFYERTDEGWGEAGSIFRGAINIDPTNALYDYLLGIRSHASSQTNVEREVGEDHEWILVVDPDLLQDCQDHLQSGFAKTEFVMHSDRFGAMADYVKHAPGSLAAKLSFGDFGSPAPAPVIWQARRLFEDYDLLEADNLAEIDGIALWFALQNFNARWKSQCPAEDVPAQADFFRLAGSTQLSESEGRLVAATYAWQRNYLAEDEQFSHWNACSYAAVVASALGWALCGTAILAALTTWGLRRIYGTDGTGPGPAVCYTFWWIALGGTLAGLGFFCAWSERILVIRPWIFVLTMIGISCCAVAAAFWFGIRFVLRQGKRRPNERSILFNLVRLALAVTASFSLLIPLLCVADPKLRRAVAATWSDMPSMVQFSWRVTVPADSSDRISDALLQWGGHYGLAITIGMWFFMLLIFRRRSNLGATNSRATRLIGRLTGALCGITRNGLPLAAIMFLLSIAAVTQWMVHLQSKYERQLVRLANPRWVDEEIEAHLKPIETPLTESSDEVAD